MRRMLAALILSLLGWPHVVWSAVEPVPLKVKDDVMLSAINGGDSLTLTLPEFLVFRSSGAAIYHDKGFTASFMDVVELAMKTNTALESKPGLTQVLAELVTMDGSPFAANAVADYDFVFVEYWADWCAPCHQQRKAVEAYLAQNTEEKILWLYIRRDPTLLPNVAVKKQ